MFSYYIEPIPLSEKAIQASKVYKLMLSKHNSDAAQILREGDPVVTGEAGDEDTDDEDAF